MRLLSVNTGAVGPLQVGQRRFSSAIGKRARVACGSVKPLQRGASSTCAEAVCGHGFRVQPAP